MEMLLEHKLTEMPAVLRHAIEQSPGCISISDMREPDQPLIYVNQRFLNLTGYKAHEVIGRNCRFLQGPLTDPETAKEIRSIISNKQSGSVQIVNYRKDGTTFFNLLKLSPVFDDQKQLIAYIGIQEDYTAVIERQKSALEESKFHALGLFSSGLAHEINNFLQPMVGLPEILKKKIENKFPEILEDLEIIEESAVAASEILKSTLGYAKCSEETVEMDILEQSKLSLKFLQKLTPATISLNFDSLIDADAAAEKIFCEINSYQLTQIYMNLINNACDAMKDKGEICIQYEVVKTPTSGRSWIYLSVQNGGEPIPKSLQDHIFEKFVSVKKTTKGTGLGLSIVKSIIEQWDGLIEFKSNKKDGTIFYIKLPIVRIA